MKIGRFASFTENILCGKPTKLIRKFLMKLEVTKF